MFKIDQQVESWLGSKQITFLNKSKEVDNKVIYKAYHCVLTEEQFDELHEYTSNLAPTYPIDICFDREMSVLQAPGGDMIAFVTKWELLQIEHDGKKKNGRKRKAKKKALDVVPSSETNSTG